MNILHIGLLSHYTDGMLYQDNILAELNYKAGHKVTFISDVYYFDDGVLKCGPEEDKILDNGVRLIRLNYDKVINAFVSEKIQKVDRLKAYIEEIKPDSILYHGCCGYEIMNVAKYVREHPNTLFYVDSHEDFHTSARFALAKFAYKYVHGIFLKKAIKQAKKILYITLETKDYLTEMYPFIPEEMLEYYPLGGIISEQEERIKNRENIIREYGLGDDAIICAHSGKMVKEKKTAELLNAFHEVQDERCHLFVFGSVPKEQEAIITSLLKRDKRVHFLGWKKNEEITDFLAGVDLYCQPGTQSATFQVALCCGCATMIYPYPSHKYLIGEDCFYVTDEAEMVKVFESILKEENKLEEIKRNSFNIAKEKLDYIRLAERICV